MKKLLTLLLICVLPVAISNAQDDKTEKPLENTSFYQNDAGEIVETTKPIFQFEGESHDFGQITEGPKYTHEFKFKNVGSEPLIVKGVKASCGCTTPKKPEEPIMPGEEGVITVVYNSKNRPGNFNKAVTITSNAVTPTKRVFIKGKVIKSEVPVAPEKPKSIVAEPEGK